MRTLGKPRLDITANFAYTDAELQGLSDFLEPVFEVEVKRHEEFQQGITEPIIFFIFYGISSGFVQAIGKELWESIKKEIAAVVAKKRESGISDMELVVDRKKGNIRFRLHSDDPKLVEKAIDQFPKALESTEKTEYEIDYYEFDNDTGQWVH